MIRFFTWAAFFLLAGCMTAQFAPSRVAQSFPVRTPPEKIEIFRAQAPAKKFIEIGAVNACCSHDANEMVDKLREKASESGGDALIGLDINAVGGATASVIRYE